MKNVGRVFDAAKQDSAGFEPYAQQIAILFRPRAGGAGGRAGQPFLHRAGRRRHQAAGDCLPAPGRRLFGLDHAAYERVGPPSPGRSVGPLPDPRPNPRRLLRGGQEDLSPTYLQHHPDTLMAKGLPKHFIEMATRRWRRSSAPDQIERERGLNSVDGWLAGLAKARRRLSGSIRRCALRHPDPGAELHRRQDRRHPVAAAAGIVITDFALAQS